MEKASIKTTAQTNVSGKTRAKRFEDGLPEILSPTVDIIFKILFGDERNRDILADFLSAVLGFRVTKGAITLVDPHLARDNIDDKLGILDIKLRLKSGKYVNIEMQVGNLKSIFKRVEYYIDNMVVRQMKGGDDYDKILPVVAIIVFKDTVLPETKRFHCEFGTLEKTEHFELHGLKAVHTLELPKLPAGGGGKLEDWLTFIKSEKREDYMAVVQKSKPMRRALEVLEEASADQRVRDEYVYRVMAIADEKARRAYYRDKAKEDIKMAKEEIKKDKEELKKDKEEIKTAKEELKKDKEEIKAEGKAEERLKNARAMKAEGMPSDAICRITGLSEEEIRQMV